MNENAKKKPPIVINMLYAPCKIIGSARNEKLMFFVFEIAFKQYGAINMWKRDAVISLTGNTFMLKIVYAMFSKLAKHEVKNIAKITKSFLGSSKFEYMSFFSLSEYIKKIKMQ